MVGAAGLEGIRPSLTEQELGELKVAVRNWLGILSSNGNLSPEAWNVFYALRDSGLVEINRKKAEEKYAVARAFVALLLNLYGERDRGRESILFDQRMEEKRLEHNKNLKEGEKKISRPRKKSTKTLIEYINRNTTGGVAALMAYLR